MYFILGLILGVALSNNSSDEYPPHDSSLYVFFGVSFLTIFILTMVYNFYWWHKEKKEKEQ